MSTTPRRPGLLDGLAAAMDECYAPRPPRVRAVACGGCGRTDDVLTETPAGNRWCPICRDGAAVDANNPHA